MRSQEVGAPGIPRWVGHWVSGEVLNGSAGGESWGAWANGEGGVWASFCYTNFDSEINTAGWLFPGCPRAFPRGSTRADWMSLPLAEAVLHVYLQSVKFQQYYQSYS